MTLYQWPLSLVGHDSAVALSTGGSWQLCCCYQLAMINTVYQRWVMILLYSLVTSGSWLSYIILIGRSLLSCLWHRWVMTALCTVLRVRFHTVGHDSTLSLSRGKKSKHKFAYCQIINIDLMFYNLQLMRRILKNRKKTHTSWFLDSPYLRTCFWLFFTILLVLQCWNFRTTNGGYRNRVRIGLLYRPTRLHRLS